MTQMNTCQRRAVAANVRGPWASYDADERPYQATSKLMVAKPQAVTDLTGRNVTPQQ